MNNLKKAFTLIEMLIVVTVLALVFGVVIQIYDQLIHTKTDIYVRSILAKNTNLVVERINLILENYNIDYEEYFNRRMVGCSSPNGGESFTWDVGLSGYCTNFTTYGNGNHIDSPNTGNNILYYCTSTGNTSKPSETPGGNDCEAKSGNGITGTDYIYKEKSGKTLSDGYGCWRSAGTGVQSYGEYKEQFWDMGGNKDGKWGCRNDDDDLDLGMGPIAIGNNTGVKELYLISKDGTKRTFIRRKLVYSGDLNNDHKVDHWEKLYKLQILKLRGFDLGTGHDGKGDRANDGYIDTWACDKLEGFICNGSSLQDVGYTGYNLPKDVDDGWKDLTITDLSIKKLNFVIYPDKKPDLIWSGTNYQIFPYIGMSLKTSFYGKNYMSKLNPASLSGYEMDINTIFAAKAY